jgi:hypothetical protein
LPVVLYGIKTWSVTLRKERRLRVFENKVLRRIFEPKKEEVTWESRRLQNEELNHLYSSRKIIRSINSIRIMDEACSTYGGDKRCLQSFGGET